jgi:hypothetical protein
MLLLSVYIAVSVELLHQKPKCSLTNMSFKVKWLYSLLYITLSKVFEKTGSNEIGL